MTRRRDTPVTAENLAAATGVQVEQLRSALARVEGALDFYERTTRERLRAGNRETAVTVLLAELVALRAPDAVAALAALSIVRRIESGARS